MEHRVSGTQLEELLDYLMAHPNLAKGVGLGARSKETVDRQWQELATRLNAHGRGTSKNGQRWKRYWADLKHKVKMRAANYRREACSTGGGPASQGDLSEYDKKVLAIIGESAVYGDRQHKVPAVDSSTLPPAGSSSEMDLCPSPLGAEEVVTGFLSPPETGSMQQPFHSPSTSGQTCRVYSAQARTASPNREQAQSCSIEDSPISRRRPRQQSSIRGRALTGSKRIQRADTAWVIDLERRRVDAETKSSEALLQMAKAATIIAEAARSNTEAALSNAQTARLNADTAQMREANMKNFLEIMEMQAKSLALILKK